MSTDPLFGKLFEAVGIQRMCEAKREPLVGVTVIADDETGMYDIGELDFAVHGNCESWLEQDKRNRSRLVEHLRWLANAFEKGEF